MTSTIEIRPLTGTIGARVTGLRLNEVGSQDLEALRTAFLEHCVLWFPDQHLDAASQLAFARYWGEVAVTPMLKYLDEYPGVLRLCNMGKEQSITENWHYDSTFMKTPHALTILAAQRLPVAGGDTMWSNQYLAYETLSSGMRSLLSGLKGCFRGSRIAKAMGVDSDIPSAYHPIVRTHPVTGRKALYVGYPGETLTHIEGMTPVESLPLTRYLYEHSTSPDRVYRHRWNDGDVIMWDNRCTMHYAVHDYGDQARELNRVTILGDVPV